MTYITLDTTTDQNVDSDVATFLLLDDQGRTALAGAIESGVDVDVVATLSINGYLGGPGNGNFLQFTPVLCSITDGSVQSSLRPVIELPQATAMQVSVKTQVPAGQELRIQALVHNLRTYPNEPNTFPPVAIQSQVRGTANLSA